MTENIRNHSFLTLLFAVVVSLCGCAGKPAGAFRFETGTSDKQVLTQKYSEGICRVNDRGDCCCVFLLNDDQAQDPANGSQMLIVRTFWMPRPGSNFVEETCTNMNIDLLIETQGQTALYRGTGLAQAHPKNAHDNVELDVSCAQLDLTAHSAGFKPAFTTLRVAGAAKAQNYPEMVEKRMVQFHRKCQGLSPR